MSSSVSFVPSSLKLKLTHQLWSSDHSSNFGMEDEGHENIDASNGVRKRRGRG